MVSGERVVALIPVRGGSQGIPRKNEQILGGHPLMAWAIEVAKATPEIDRIIVSTEDSSLASIGQRYGAEVCHRPAHLATHTAGVYDVIMDIRDKFREQGELAKFMVVLEVTSPFRSPELISRGLKLLSQGYQSTATFTACHTHPSRAWRIEGGVASSFIEGANPWVPRQALGPAFELTGELYAFELQALSQASSSLLVGRSAPLIIDGEYCVDIDYPRDLELARILFGSSPLAKLRQR